MNDEYVVILLDPTVRSLLAQYGSLALVSGTTWSPPGHPTLTVDAHLSTVVASGKLIATSTDGSGNPTAVTFPALNATLSALLSKYGKVRRIPSMPLYWSYPGAQILEGVPPLEKVSHGIVNFALSSGQVVPTAYEQLRGYVEVMLTPTDGTVPTLVTDRNYGSVG